MLLRSTRDAAASRRRAAPRGRGARRPETGAIACDSAVDAISESEFIVVCVSDYPVWNTLSNQQNLRQSLASRTVIQLTTGTLEEVQAHEQWISQSGTQLIDGSIMCFPSQKVPKNIMGCVH